MDVIWTIVGVLVPVLIGVGMSLLGYAEPEFRAVRACFWLSAIVLGLTTAAWQWQTSRPLLIRVTASVLVGSLLFAGLPELLRWVSQKEIRRDRVTGTAGTPASRADEARRSSQVDTTERVEQPTKKPTLPSRHRSVQEPPAPLNEIDKPGTSVSPPAFVSLRIASQEQAISTDQNLPYCLKVIVQTDKEISPLALIFFFDARAEKVLYSDGTFMEMMTGNTFGTPSQTEWLLQRESPPLTASHPLVLTIYSRTRLRVVKLSRFEYAWPLPEHVRLLP